MWHMTCDTWHMTFDTWHVKCDKWQNFSSLDLTDCDLWYYEDLEEKAHRPNQSIKNKAFCRTAPATPGLLKIHEILLCLKKKTNWDALIRLSKSKFFCATKKFILKTLHNKAHSTSYFLLFPVTLYNCGLVLSIVYFIIWLD